LIAAGSFFLLPEVFGSSFSGAGCCFRLPFALFRLPFALFQPPFALFRPPFALFRRRNRRVVTNLWFLKRWTQEKRHFDRIFIKSEHFPLIIAIFPFKLVLRFSMFFIPVQYKSNFLFYCVHIF